MGNQKQFSPDLFLMHGNTICKITEDLMSSCVVERVCFTTFYSYQQSWRRSTFYISIFHEKNWSLLTLIIHYCTRTVNCLYEFALMKNEKVLYWNMLGRIEGPIVFYSSNSSIWAFPCSRYQTPLADDEQKIFHKSTSLQT